MATTWQIGDIIQNRWEIHKILTGGMGIVYVVYDHELGDAYAAKTFQDEVFASSPIIAERFTQEALTWVNLDAHQNITRACMVNNIEGKPYLFLEYVSGGDLGGWIGTQRLTNDLSQVLRFAIQFCDGMTHALAKGIKAHRDIKPQNCLITQDGTLKVTDFGLAKVFDHARLTEIEAPGVESLSISLTRSGIAAGTCTHMAPEQFDDAKRVDMRGDIYSFGVMLYQLLTGRLPFAGRTWQEIEQLHKTQQAPALSTQHSAFKSVIETCLAKDPAQRFANFRAVREELAERYEELTGEKVIEPASGAELSPAEWNNKGTSLGELGRPEEAIACLDRALEINPHYEMALYNKGNVLAYVGRSEEAIAYLDRALEINPRYAHAWYTKGTALGHLGRPEEAIACYDCAIEINPRDEAPWANKGHELNNLGRSGEAIACCDHALAIDPRCVSAWYRKGEALDSLGRSEEALLCFDHILDINPRLAGAWANMGKVLNSLGKSEGAMACCDRALEIDPRLAGAWANKGKALDSLGRLEEAIECYDRTLEIDPRLAQAWHNKGDALDGLSRSGEAIACYDRALELNPRYANAWHNKGVQLGNAGRIRDALACFEEAERLGFPEATQGIAMCRQMLDKGKP